jgi:hypothetical protein
MIRCRFKVHERLILDHERLLGAVTGDYTWREDPTEAFFKDLEI